MFAFKVVALLLFVATAVASNPRLCDTSVYPNYVYNALTESTTCTGVLTDHCAYTANQIETSNPTRLRFEPDFTAPVSRLEAVDSEDYLFLALDIPDKYYNEQLVFDDAEATKCVFTNIVADTTHTVADLDQCYFTKVYQIKWSDSYNKDGLLCGWTRSVDEDTKDVSVTLDVGVSVTEDIGSSRLGVITRQLLFSHPIRIDFVTRVLATPVNIQVFAPVRTIAAITTQSVTVDEDATPITATLELELFTEVQLPFELINIQSVSKPGDATLVAWTVETQVRPVDNCVTGENDCGASWTLFYTQPAVRGGRCEFDGTYKVSFEVTCADDFLASGNCPIDAETDNVEITMQIDTSDHCPIVVDTVQLFSDLYVYDAPARTAGDARDDFVGDGTLDDGQTVDNTDWQVAYFSAPTYSPQVTIEYTTFIQVWIIRENGDKIVLLDTYNEHNDVGTYDGVAEIQCDPAPATGVPTESATAAAVSLQPGCSPAKPGGSTYAFNFKHGQGGLSEASPVAGEESLPKFEFDIRTDASGFAMANDAIEDMVVHAILEVAYSNPQGKLRYRHGKLRMFTEETGATQRSTQARLSFSQQPSNAQTSPSSSPLVAANVLMGAAALAVLAIIAVVAIVTRRSGPRTKNDKKEGVQLQNSSSTVDVVETQPVVEINSSQV